MIQTSHEKIKSKKKYPISNFQFPISNFFLVHKIEILQTENWLLFILYWIFTHFLFTQHFVQPLIFQFVLFGKSPVLCFLENMQFLFTGNNIVGSKHRSGRTNIVVVAPAIPTRHFHKTGKIHHIVIF